MWLCSSASEISWKLQAEVENIQEIYKYSAIQSGEGVLAKNFTTNTASFHHLIQILCGCIPNLTLVKQVGSMSFSHTYLAVVVPSNYTTAMTTPFIKLNFCELQLPTFMTEINCHPVNEIGYIGRELTVSADEVRWSGDWWGKVVHLQYGWEKVKANGESSVESHLKKIK